MKILIYSQYFFPIRGGVQTNVFELACGLSEWHRDHSDCPPLEVTVVTRTRGQTPEDGSWPFRLVRTPRLSRLFQVMRQADVIHIAGPAMLPMMIGLLLRKPVVIEHHGYQAICPNGILLMGTDRTVCPGHFMAGRYLQCVRCNAGDMGWYGSIRSLVLMFPRRWLSKLVPSNVAISNHVARRLALPSTQTILYGIRDPGCARLPQNGNEVQIGYVGRLVQEKGVPVLLKAAKRLSDYGFSFHLTLVGGGPLRKQLEEESNELGLGGRVTFTGDLAGADLEQAVRPIQIVVMPTLCEETAGLAVIEQMMRGGVVVASDIGGLSEVVGDAGLKFVPGDAQALASCIRRVIGDPAFAASLRTAARARAVEAFTRERMIRDHVALYCRQAAGFGGNEPSEDQQPK